MVAASGSHGRRKLDLLLHPNLLPSLSVTLSPADLKSFHAHIISTGRAGDAFAVGRLLAASCVASGSGDLLLRHAAAVFSAFRRPTLPMYNSMIRGFSRSSHPAESGIIFLRMLRSGVSPDWFTFPFLLRSCTAAQLGGFGRGIHGQALKLGLSSDVYVANNLISFYAEGRRDMCSAHRMFDEISGLADVVSWTAMVSGYSDSGRLADARHLFDGMPERNQVSWNAMIAGYARAGMAAEARNLFRWAPERDVASWSSMVSGFAQSGLCQEALEVFDEMLATGVAPNEPAFVSAVSACAQLRDLGRGIGVHGRLEELGTEMTVTLATALVDMYFKCGCIREALQMFDEMPHRNVLTWNSVISGLALNGAERQAVSLLPKMISAGFRPNAATFVGLLSACSHAGLVDEGSRLFSAMVGEYSIRPAKEHYGCVVDLLGRAGLVKEAAEFVGAMLDDPHPELWGALAGACKVHGDVTLGEEVGKRLVGLEPGHAGRYVLLSDLYAAAMRWDDMEKVRGLLLDRGLEKNPGNSKMENEGAEPS